MNEPLSVHYTSRCRLHGQVMVSHCVVAKVRQHKLCRLLRLRRHNSCCWSYDRSDDNAKDDLLIDEAQRVRR